MQILKKKVCNVQNNKTNLNGVCRFDDRKIKSVVYKCVLLAC